MPQAHPEHNLEIETRFGRRFRCWRLSQNIGLKKVSHETGIHISFLSRLERGRAGISLGRALTLARFAQKPVAWFVQEDEV